MKLSIVLLILIPFLSLSYRNGKSVADVKYDSVIYKEDTADFANPERGFFRAAFTHTSHFKSLDKKKLVSYRKGQEIKEGDESMQVYSTLVQRVYVLDNFKNHPLSKDILRKMQKDFDIAREAGIKLVLRFNYTVKTHKGDCSEKFICPPYGDAPLSIVLKHISQLKPLLQKNADIIAAVQEGFVGIWGESYYTDYFGDASSNGLGKYTDSDWINRNKVMAALLDALPKDRMVQARTPQLKQRYIYGVSASITSSSLTKEDAFNGRDKARIGFHNDCFLDDPVSEGFDDRGNSHFPHRSDEETLDILKSFEMKDSRYIVVGGETCSPNIPHSLCSPKGDANKELKAFHFDFLNADYNGKVLGSWIKGGCIEQVKKRLGYRFFLKKAVLPTQLNTDDSFTVEFKIGNKGYSSPYNPRPVQLILRNLKTHEVFSLVLDTDIRKWYSGENQIIDTLHLPKNISSGSYEMLLNMPDKYASISKRPKYSIRLADKNVWESTSGYNTLNHSVIIK